MIRAIPWILLALGCGKSESPPSDPTGGAGDSGDHAGDSGDPGSDDRYDGICPEDVDVFTSKVWEPALGPYCLGCHSEGRMASESRLVFDAEDMLHNLRTASAVSDLLLVKPTGLHEDGHAGGTLFASDSPAWEALEFWLNWIDGICEEEEEAPCADEPLPRRLWRLDHDQYRNTVVDLLGTTSTYAQHLAADNSVNGFKNDATALVVSGLLADQYRRTAEDLSTVANISSMVPCSTEDEDATRCAAAFIEEFGTRAFRRPINAEELQTYLTLWSEIASEGGFIEGLRWVVAGMLQSPHFLYRSELGTETEAGVYSLSDWEIASELSYLLWGTMPDDALFEAAATGELHTADQISAQVDRMMADDRALETAANFMDVWLYLDRIAVLPRVGLNADLEEAMLTQTRETVKELARNEQSLNDLLLSPTTYLPDVLADHYGASGGGWVEQDGETYGGLLTHGSLLTVYAVGEASSPVHRGVVVRERMLCEDLPPPPPTLDTSPPAADPGSTTREKYEVHSSIPECASCHALIDPIGFGFEHYDHLGRWRSEEAAQPIDASGDLDGVTFDGVQDLGLILADDPRFRTCYIETWRRWGTGADACADDATDIPLTGPLEELTARTAFTTRTGAADSDGTRAAGSRLNDDAISDVAEAVGEVVPWVPFGIDFSLVEDESWDTGECYTGTVSNTTADPIIWEVRTALAGDLTVIWDAEYSMDDGVYVFVGVPWNAELSPYGTASFQVCIEF